MVRSGAAAGAALVGLLATSLGAQGLERSGGEIRASGGAKSIEAEQGGEAGCWAMSVGSTPDQTSTDRGFSVRQILDLNFRVKLAAQGTPATLEMRYYTPSNHLYQSVLVPIADEASLEVERSLPGYPFPVKVAKVEVQRDRTPNAGTDKVRTVSAPAFPVAGTMIVSNSLYGTWRAEGWIQGASAPCSLDFVIKP